MTLVFSMNNQPTMDFPCPPEEMIREELIEEIREAEKRILEGKGKSFESAGELKDFLDHVKEEE